MTDTDEIEGLAELQQKLKALAKLGDPRGALMDVVQTGAQPIVNEMKKASPVDEGNLKKSIHERVMAYGDGVFARIGPGVEYGIYLEFGTRYMAAQPYVRPGYERGKRQAVRDMGRAITWLVRAEASK